MTTLPDCDIYLTKSGEGIRYCPLGTLPPAGGGEDPGGANRPGRIPLRPSPDHPPGGVPFPPKPPGKIPFSWKQKKVRNFRFCEKFVKIL